MSDDLLFALRRKFDNLRLQQPELKRELVAERIFELDRVRIALGPDFLALVIPLINAEMPDFDEQLRSIKVIFNERIRLDDQECRAIVVKTVDLSDWLVNLFLHAVSVLAPVMRGRGDEEIVRTVRNLIELFRGLDGSQRKSALGLWGELFCIAKAQDPDESITAWHTSPFDKYDFSKGNTRVEIKTTTGVRAHHFSYEQLRPQHQIDLFVGSIVTSEVDDGISVEELLDQISRTDVSQESRSHLIITAMKTLGRAWPFESKRRFDYALADHSFEFFSGADIPCIQSPPPELSDIHFRADMQAVPAIDVRRSSVLGDLECCRPPLFSDDYDEGEGT